MAGRKVGVIILCVVAVIVATGAINAVYACPQSPGHGYNPPPSKYKDMEIRDQDENWTDGGVEGTWTASNMAPGDEFAFNGHFVGLRGYISELAISCDYVVSEESPPVETDTDPNTGAHPDTMAKYMVITRCTYRDGKWRIDCLTGKSTGITSKKKDWRIDDMDRDGRLTFYDLKKDPLVNLPPPQSCGNNGSYFEMSVRFDPGAGNEFQGDTFNLTMLYRAGGTCGH
jgi:hypothetical protein